MTLSCTTLWKKVWAVGMIWSPVQSAFQAHIPQHSVEYKFLKRPIICKLCDRQRKKYRSCTNTISPLAVVAIFRRYGKNWRGMNFRRQNRSLLLMKVREKRGYLEK